MEKTKLTYFDIDGGRAEATRIAMSVAGIEFEDRRLSFSEFSEMRESTPLNAVPILEINGVAYTQCNAMNRYAGRLAGLYPDDPWQSLLCDEVMDVVEDSYHSVMRTFGLQGDELRAARKELSDGMLTRCLKLLRMRLAAAGGEYFSDHRFTVADIKVFVWLRHLKSGGLEHVPTDLADELAPRLLDHMDRIAAEPAVVAYYSGRGK